MNVSGINRHVDRYGNGAVYQKFVGKNILKLEKIGLVGVFSMPGVFLPVTEWAQWLISHELQVLLNFHDTQNSLSIVSLGTIGYYLR